MESEDFVKFAMNFIEKLKNKWWSISFDERKGGEQILFNGEFYVDNSAKVHTPKLSTIYTLGTNKKDPGGVNFSNMVELAGTAPASAGLSWLVVYRLSSFYGLESQDLNEQTSGFHSSWLSRQSEHLCRSNQMLWNAVSLSDVAIGVAVVT